MNPQDLQLPGLDTADRIRLLACGASRPFANGDTLITEGLHQPHLLLLLGGEVAVLQGCREITRLRRGAVAGEMGWLADAPATASLVARSAGQLLALDPDRLPDVQLAGRLRRALNRVLVRRLREANTRLPEWRFAGTPERRWLDAPTLDEAPPDDPALADFIARYEQLSPHRVWWRWAAHGLAQLTLDTVPAAERDAHHGRKLLAMLLELSLTDLTLLRPDLLDAAVRLPFDSPTDEPWLDLVGALWRAHWQSAQALPAFHRHRALLACDWQHLFAGLRHTRLVRQTPSLLNPAEHTWAPSHGLGLPTYCTLDVMASPTFDLVALGPLRNALNHGRALAQIAHLVVTWHRSTATAAFADRVFALAFTRAVVNLADLEPLPTDNLVAPLHESGLEDELVEAWRTHRRHLLYGGAQLDGLGFDALLGGLELLLGMSLAARGWG